MKKVMLVGGGKIGIAITEFLSSTGDYKVTVADRDAASLQRMPRKNVELRKVDILSPEFVHEVEGHDIVLSATPYNLTAHGRRGLQARERALPRPDRGCGIHPHHQAPRRGRQGRVHSAMRPGARLHLDRRLRSCQEVRQAARRADARRRAPGVPAQCAQIQSHLVDGRG